MDSPNQEISPARKAAVAERIARDVVKMDPTILSLLVIDLKDGSKVLAVARSPSLPVEDYVSAALVQKFGIAATVVWGAAENAAQLMGKREFVIGAFKQQLVLLIGLPDYGMLLAIRLNRSSNAEHLYVKIADRLGIG